MYGYITGGIVLVLVIIWIIIKKVKDKEKIKSENIRQEYDKKINELEKEKEGVQRDNDRLKEEVSNQDKKIEALNGKINEKENIITGLKKDLDYKTKELKNQEEEAEKWHEKFRNDFEHLANEILDKKTKKFTEQNKTNLDSVLNPLKENIQNFEKKIKDNNEALIKEKSDLINQIKNLTELNKKVSEDANNLTKALKGQTKTQGNWGEMILEKILERSGLNEGEEYEKQSGFKDQSGKRYQPDIIIHYPGDKHVIIDSKVSLTDYERYVNSDDEDEQKEYLKQHINSVKNHVNELAAKNYQDVYKLNSLDFVIMFMPVEPAYLLAIQKDQQLWQYAFEKRVMILGPTNLVASLKMISNMWHQEKFNKNARKIADESSKLLDKLNTFVEDYKKVGEGIKKLGKEYDTSMNKLSEGKGNLIRKAQQIKELGVKTKKELKEEDMPQKLSNEDF